MITKSLSADFGGNLNPGQLGQEIVQNFGITTVYDCISTDGDIVNIYFADVLTAGEITILNSIIAAHVPGNFSQILFDITGTLGTKLTLQSSQTLSYDILLPDITDTLVNTNSAETLTNKTISSVGNTITCPVSSITGVFGMSSGGTGASSFPVGNILVGNGTSNITSVANPVGSIVGTSDSQVLTNKTIRSVDNTITLAATDISGTLTVAAGGTGATTLTSGNILRGNGTSAITATLATPAAAIVGTTDIQTLTNKTVTSATNTIAARYIANTAAAVLIDATVPSTGQILTTDSSTTTSWKTNGITWKNVWNSGTAYVFNDVVLYNGTVFLCCLANTNQIPTISPTYWCQVMKGVNWLGTWNSGTNYYVNDLVTLGGTVYICILANINFSPLNATYWTPITTSAIAGTDKQVQYNNAGLIGAATNLSVDTDGYAVVSDVVGAAPAAATDLKIYSQSRAGFRTLATVDALSRINLLQCSLFSHKIGFWGVAGGTSTVFLANFNNTVVGNVYTRTVSTTNRFTAYRRIGYGTGATANAVAGIRHATLQFSIGAGFLYVAKFGMSSATNLTTQRSFIGFTGVTGVIGNVNPTSLGNILGFGNDLNDTVLSFMYNDATSTASKASLTGSFPSRALSTNMMEARIYADPATSTVYFSLEVMGGSYYESSVNTNIPLSTTLLTPQIWINNSTGGGDAIIDVVSQYIESDF